MVKNKDNYGNKPILDIHFLEQIVGNVVIIIMNILLILHFVQISFPAQLILLFFILFVDVIVTHLEYLSLYKQKYKSGWCRCKYNA